MHNLLTEKGQINVKIHFVLGPLLETPTIVFFPRTIFAFLDSDDA